MVFKIADESSEGGIIFTGVLSGHDVHVTVTVEVDRCQDGLIAGDNRFRQGIRKPVVFMKGSECESGLDLCHRCSRIKTKYNRTGGCRNSKLQLQAPQPMKQFSEFVQQCLPLIGGHGVTPEFRYQFPAPSGTLDIKTNYVWGNVHGTETEKIQISRMPLNLQNSRLISFFVGTLQSLCGFLAIFANLTIQNEQSSRDPQRDL